MNYKNALYAVSIMIVGTILFCGCESSSSDSSSPSVDVTGRWTGTFHNETTGSTGTHWIELVQSGNSVTGQHDQGTLTGSVSGNTFSFTMTFPWDNPVTGSMTVTGDTMTGTWTDRNDRGTGTATRQ